MVNQTAIKHFAKRNLKRLGWEIKRADPDWIDFLTDRGITTVLDVGANVGQFGELLRLRGYRGKIISFEPLRAAYQQLAAKAAADGHWEAHNFALGTHEGRTTINVSDYSPFSSMLPLTGAALRYNSGTTVTYAEEIEVKRLDGISIGPSDNVFLKIDTQGFEKTVLEGGHRVLSAMKGVLMELPIIHLYDGTWHLHEAVEYMSRAGFVPAQFHPVNYHSADRVSLVEVDCLFRPRDSRLD